ncbi:hypothetical protein [Streptomyces chartreusis]|uniref:hypothetical protein n=1 Tax=Streptomyces chartreusis TaxID=1969 RepID=UPI00386F969B|nr:hypothetical protein OG938_48655 [Streptomyces chartreusis]
MSARTRTALRLLISAVVGLVALLVVVSPAHAAPTPSPTPTGQTAEERCELLRGPAYDFCIKDNGGDGGGDSPALTDPTSTLDPLVSLADGIAEGAAWVVTKLSDAVTATADVDFTNAAFLKTYALVFAASTFLVVMIWLWAVIKRAVRGVPLHTAFGEAVGLLWVTVLASAFTPLVLYVLVSAVDSITQGLAGGSSHAKFFDTFAKALTENGDGGPFVKIVLSLIAMLAAGVVWIEMIIRAALLYAGAVLGTIVYSGLVDKALWSRVRRWAGIMVAIILVKPIIVIVLQLANALTTGDGSDSIGAIMSGLSILILAIFASAMIFRMIPGMGDEIVAARRDSYDPASRQSSAVVTRPVTGITHGINTHAGRDSASRAPASTQASSSVAHASSGIAAHSTRPTSSGGAGGRAGSGVPSQDNRGGSGD